MKNSDIFDPGVYERGVSYEEYSVLRSEAPVFCHAQPDGPGSVDETSPAE